MPSKAVEIILVKLPDAKRSGKGWKARCPAHDDHKPSLSISEGDDGRALLKCHAGCSQQAVVQALGLKMADLMPDSVAKHSGQCKNERRITATYDYTDEHGTLLFEVVRFHPKGFAQRRLNGQGSYLWNMNGVRRVLYRLPVIIEAGPESFIFLLEGEKDVDRLFAEGLVATTTSGGAKKAHLTDLVPLHKRHVVIVPDNDKAGREHAQQVAAALQDKAASVRILHLPGLPDKGDVSDWLDNGDDGETLMRLAEQTSLWKPSADSVPIQTGQDGWPDPKPLPDELLPVESFQMDMLPRDLRAYVEDTAERLQCPPDFIAAPLLCVLGAVIGRRLGIRPKRHDDWLVIPNLWGFIVGRPSLMKTPAIKQPLSIIQRLEASAREQFNVDIAAHEATRMVAEAQKKEIQKQLQKAVAAGDDTDGIVAQLADCAPAPPVRKRFITNDTTVEKLGELLNENSNGIFVFRDELTGWLHNLEKDNQQGARAFYLEAWDGTGRFTYDRIGRGTIDIEAACVSVFGGIQPGKIAPYVRGAVSGGIDDDGLLQRFQIAVWPDSPANWQNIDRWPNNDARKAIAALVSRLHSMDVNTQGGCSINDPDNIPWTRFDEPAQQVFNAWRENLELELRSGEDHPAIESHKGKYRSLIPSLALIFHLCDHQAGPVGLPAVELAIRWGQYLESHARRIYGAGIAGEVVAAKTILKRIRQGQLQENFTARMVYRANWAGLGDRESVEAALDLLADHGWILPHEDVSKIGRPTICYAIYPNAQLKTRPTPTDKTDKTPTEGTFGSFVSDPTPRSDNELGAA